MKRLIAYAATICLALAWAPAARSASLDFEGFLDTTPLTHQYPNVTFTNATVLTAGLSLNEVDFPPLSGTNVILDDSGAMNAVFSTPLSSWAGYLTYTSPLTLTFFGSGNAVLGVVNSAFSNNTAAGGDAGSAPNELLFFSSLAGIEGVQILGDPGGGSFTADDWELTASAVSDVPEPALLAPVGAILLILFRRGRSL